MKYYIIAGEASGDLHGSNLILELKKLNHAISIRCWGGELMESAGATLVKHYKELAFMGFTEVISNLGTIMKNLRFCKEDITAFQPDAIILIDYPGFNLRIAKWAKEQHFKVIYFISPQVWAWKENRVKGIRKTVDKMLVILPFEQAFYDRWSYPVEYIGHPLVEVIDKFRKKSLNGTIKVTKTNQPKIVALLPGSRKQEILKKLPIMLQTCRLFPDCAFVVAKAPGLDDEFYTDLLQDFPNVSSVRNDTYKLLTRADAALVTSGTATLETALFGVPEVVCYKGSQVSYWIARKLIRVKYISLVNLIMDKLVVTELIQDELTVQNLVKELNLLLHDQVKKAQLERDYKKLREILSAGGNASENAAKSIVNYLSVSLEKNQPN